jgi:hypothetical protein
MTTEAGGSMSETETIATETAALSDSNGWEWAIVEIFGHRRHAGRAREEERFGSKMLRIDVPVKGDPAANGWETHWYGGASIFSYTITDEPSVMRANKPYEAPSTYRLPAPEDDFGGDDIDDEAA